jgi:hypothetical protein
MRGIVFVPALILSALLTGGSAAVAKPPPTTCLDRLNSNTYTCDVKGSDTSEFTDTLSFSSGSLTSSTFPKFALG